MQRPQLLLDLSSSSPACDIQSAYVMGDWGATAVRCTPGCGSGERWRWCQARHECFFLASLQQRDGKGWLTRHKASCKSRCLPRRKSLPNSPQIDTHFIVGQKQRKQDKALCNNGLDHCNIPAASIPAQSGFWHFSTGFITVSAM